MRYAALFTVFVIFSQPLQGGDRAVESIAQLRAGQFAAIHQDMLSMSPATVQNQGFFNSFVGRIDLNNLMEDVFQAEPCETPQASAFAEIDWLLERTRTSKMLMFNENHLIPSARVFVRSLLPALRQQGFTHIGFEGYKPFDRYPAHTDALSMAFYSKEPVFLALVKEARALGFTLFGYESVLQSKPEQTFQEKLKVRELGQAANIVTQVRQAPSASKFVIFAGWGHIHEQAEKKPGAGAMMAWHVKSKLGIDPLTVDLVSCGFATQDTDPSVRIPVTDNGEAVVIPSRVGKVDVVVQLPFPKNKKDYVHWYRRFLGKPLPIPANMQSDSKTLVIQAFKQNELLASDRILLKPGEKYPLYLSPGVYELVAHSWDGTQLARQQVNQD